MRCVITVALPFVLTIVFDLASLALDSVATMAPSPARRPRPPRRSR